MRYMVAAAVMMAAAAGCTQDRSQAKIETGADMAAPAAERLPASREDLLALYVDTQAIGHDRALTLHRLAMEKSDKAMKAGEYAQAAEAARDALVVVETNRQYFGESESAALRIAAQGRETTAGAQKLLAEQNNTAGVRRSDAAEVARAQRAKRVEMAMEEAQKFAEQRRYIEASDALKQALALDPTSAPAKLQLRLMEDKLGYRHDAEMSHRKAMETSKQSLGAKETLVPYSEPLTYPEDWVEKTRERTGTGG